MSIQNSLVYSEFQSVSTDEFFVGDVVLFQPQSAFANRFFTDTDTDITYEVYNRGVVVYAHPEHHWCTVQYARNQRACVYHTDLIKTNCISKKLILVDSRVSDELLSRARIAAKNTNNVVQVVDLRCRPIDEYIDSYLSKEMKTTSIQNFSSVYFGAIGVISMEFPAKYPELMINTIKSFKSDNENSVETLERLYTLIQPPENLSSSSLYQRVLIKDLKK